MANKATVHCGKDFVDWQDFADAVALLDSAETADQRLSEAARKVPFKDYVHRPFEEISTLGAVKLVEATHTLFRTSPLDREPLSTLENLVCQMSSFRVTEPRDAIFSLLAIAKDVNPKRGDFKPDTSNHTLHEDPETLERGWKAVQHVRDRFQSKDSEDYVVDYEAPVIDVYAQFIEFVVRKADKTRALDIICRPWAPAFTLEHDQQVTHVSGIPERPQNVKMPSWIVSVEKAPFNVVIGDSNDRPDESDKNPLWTMQRSNADGLIGNPDDYVRNYSAAATQSLRFTTFRTKKRPGHYSMFVNGFILDTLNHVGDTSQAGNIAGDWLKHAEWPGRIDNPPNLRSWEAFWRTLVADRDQDGRNAPPFFDRACKMVLRSQTKDVAINTNVLMDHGFGKDKSEVVTRFLRRVQYVIWNRRMAKTNDGHLGLVPTEAKAGDYICVLYGCSVPVVLRRHLNDKAKDDAEYDRTRQLTKREITLAKRVFKAFMHLLQHRRSRAKAAAKQHEDNVLHILTFLSVLVLVISGYPDYSIPAYTSMVCLAVLANRAMKNASNTDGGIGAIDSARHYLSSMLTMFRRFLTNVARVFSATPPGSTKLQTPSNKKAVNHYYELIGEAYIHNMMNGEAIAWQNAKQSDGERLNMEFEIR